MTQYSPYLQTPYPETIDLADIPKNMRDIAVSWENAWGAIWLDWVPLVTQAGAGQAVALSLDATSTARVRKVGRTAYVQGHLLVSQGVGLTGYPQIWLPYPMSDVDELGGFVTSVVGGALSTVGAVKSSFSANIGNPSVIEAFGTATARAAGDTFDIHLCYETV